MLLNARSIRDHQSFKEVFSYSVFRGCRNIERVEIAPREHLKTSLRLSDGRLQNFEKGRLFRSRGLHACNLFAGSERANCS